MGDEAPARRAADPVRHDDLPPRLAGRFRLTGVLRETPGATDHLAHDDLLDRAAVVTVAPVDPARTAVLARAAGLDHPHLVPVIDLEVDERAAGTPRAVVVTDPSGGGDLGARLGSGPMAVPDVLVCGAAVADALAHVHRAGLVHLAVGPAAVLLDEEGRARLGGTGLALAAPGTDDDGAPAGATDVRDLGALLLTALPERRAPRRGTTSVLPRGVRPLLRRMTDGDPAVRPAADEVAAVLRRAALAASPVPGRPGSAAARVPRGVIVAAAVAAAALVAGTVAAVVTSPVQDVVADGPAAATPPPALVVPSDPGAAGTRQPPGTDPGTSGTGRPGPDRSGSAPGTSDDTNGADDADGVVRARATRTPTAPSPDPSPTVTGVDRAATSTTATSSPAAPPAPSSTPPGPAPASPTAAAPTDGSGGSASDTPAPAPAGAGPGAPSRDASTPADPTGSGGPVGRLVAVVRDAL